MSYTIPVKSSDKVKFIKVHRRPQNFAKSPAYFCHIPHDLSGSSECRRLVDIPIGQIVNVVVT